MIPRLLALVLAVAALAPAQLFQKYVKVDTLDPRYLAYTDGTPYIPIGLNMIAPPGGANGNEEESFRVFESWLKNLSENGGNYVRFWLSSPFWDVENEKSGVYDERRALRIERGLELCRKYNIRVKLTMEHFRSINEPKPQTWAAKPLYDLVNGGPARSMADFLDGEASRAQFRKKIQWYAQRFGNSPAIYGWELWNEINAVRGGDYLAWTGEMLKELHRNFAKNLCMQSLGSFDTDRVRETYRRHSTMPGNDLAQIHRYLDLGASLDVCKGPMDVLAADAVREVQSYNPKRPIILAESGAVEPKHTGPFKLYAKDTEGTLLHDVLFAPFFAGAAGAGQIWHWDSYVAKNNLWKRFSAFAEMVKGLDPTYQKFTPSVNEQGQLRVYKLKGRGKMLLWCRDMKNTWQRELAEDIAPERLRNLTIDIGDATVDKLYTVRILDPWTNKWTKGKMQKGKIQLPEFSRSIVVRLD